MWRCSSCSMARALEAAATLIFLVLLFFTDERKNGPGATIWGAEAAAPGGGLWLLRENRAVEPETKTSGRGASHGLESVRRAGDGVGATTVKDSRPATHRMKQDAPVRPNRPQLAPRGKGRATPSGSRSVGEVLELMRNGRRRIRRQLQSETTESTGSRLFPLLGGILPDGGNNIIDNVLDTMPLGGNGGLLSSARTVLGGGGSNTAANPTSDHTQFITLGDWSLISGLTSGNSPVAGVIGSLDLARTIAMDMTNRAYAMSSMLQGLSPDQLTQRLRGFLDNATGGWAGNVAARRALLEAEVSGTSSPVPSGLVDSAVVAQQVALGIAGRLQMMTDKAVNQGRELVGSLGLLEALFSGGARLPLVDDILAYDHLVRSLGQNPDSPGDWAALVSTLRRLQTQLLPFPDFFELDGMQSGMVTSAVDAIEDVFELLRQNPLRLGNEIVDALERVARNLVWLDDATLLPRVQLFHGVDLLALLSTGEGEVSLPPFRFELGSSFSGGYVFEELRKFFFDHDRLLKVFGDLTQPLLSLEFLRRGLPIDMVSTSLFGPAFWDFSTSWWIPESIREVAVIGDALRHFEDVLASAATPLQQLTSFPESLFGMSNNGSLRYFAPSVLNEVIEQLGEILSGQSTIRATKLLGLKDAESHAQSFLGALRELSLSRELLDALFAVEPVTPSRSLRATTSQIEHLLANHKTRLGDFTRARGTRQARARRMRRRRRLGAADGNPVHEAATSTPSPVSSTSSISTIHSTLSTVPRTSTGPTASVSVATDRRSDAVANAFVTMSVAVGTLYSFVDSLRTLDATGLCDKYRQAPGGPEPTVFSKGLRALSEAIDATDSPGVVELLRHSEEHEHDPTAEAAVSDALTIINAAALLGDAGAIVDAAPDEESRDSLLQLLIGTGEDSPSGLESADLDEVQLMCELDRVSESLILRGLLELLYSVNIGLDLLSLEGENVAAAGVKYCQQVLDGRDILDLPPGVETFLRSDCLQLGELLRPQSNEQLEPSELPDDSPDSPISTRAPNTRSGSSN